MRKLAFVAILLVACGKGGSGGGLAKPLADAEDLVAVGQCDAAVKTAGDYAASHPKDANAFLVLGDAHVCAAFANRGEGDPSSSVAEADRAYASAALLAPTDRRPTISRAALDVVVGERADPAVLDSLEALVGKEPVDRAAIGLLALALDGDPTRAAKLAEQACAGRKGVDAVVPPPRSCEAGMDCGQVALMQEVRLGDALVYPAATIFMSESVDGTQVVVRDSIHPDRRPGKGWAVMAMPGFRRDDVSGARVVRERIPDLASYSTNIAYEDDQQRAARFSAIEAQKSWQSFNGVERLEDRLGLVDAVAPDSVKPKGSPVRVEARTLWNGEATVMASWSFQPVTYEILEYPERRFETSAVAPTSLGDVTAIVASGCLTDAEKRALLVGRPVEGALLWHAVSAGLDLRAARLTLKRGAVTLAWDDPPRSAVAVDGVFTKVEWPEENDHDDYEGDGE